MPAEETTPAIVLRARDYADSDRIVTLLTRDFGKLSGIAKGAKASRRRFERKLEPLSCVTLFFRRRPHGQLVFITRAEPPLEAQPIIDQDLQKIALGSYMLELADALTSEEAEATGAFDVLSACLDTLGRAAATMALRLSYELRILHASGYGLDLSRCRLCGTHSSSITESVYFVIARGGIICRACRPEAPEGAVKLDSATNRMLFELGKGVIDHTIDTGSGAASLAINRFLTNILDRRLRSADFLDSVL